MAINDLVNSLFSDRFQIHESDAYVIYSDLPKQVIEQSQALANHAFVRVRELFPELSFDGPNGLWDIVITSQQDDLLAYLGSVSPPGSGPDIIPGGTFIPVPVPHFLMPYHEMDTLDGALAHELIHAALHGTACPLWLEEGLAVTVEIHMGHRPHPLSDIDTIQALRHHFQQYQPQRIANPNVFRDPETAEHSYELAFLMVRSLIQQRDAFFEFINESDPRDGGKAALDTIYGLDLGEFAYHSVFPIKRQFSVRSAIKRLFRRGQN